jgi:multidrug resistance efflux pump
VHRAGRLLVTVAVLAVLELAAFGADYAFHTRLYVSTDNAQVDTDQIDINAPSSGLLVGWAVDQGSPLRRGEALGRIRGYGGGPQPNRVIRAPSAGTICLNNVTNGTYVQQGQMLAVAVNPAQVYITARIAESDIGRVHVGDPADVQLEAYPRLVLPGIVTEIRAATAANLDIYPSPDVNPTNIQKINQYIPVRITPYPTTIPLYPGLNATVEIRTTPGQ